MEALNYKYEGEHGDEVINAFTKDLDKIFDDLDITTFISQDTKFHSFVGNVYSMRTNSSTTIVIHLKKDINLIEAKLIFPNINNNIFHFGNKKNTTKFDELFIKYHFIKI